MRLVQYSLAGSGEEKNEKCRNLIGNVSKVLVEKVYLSTFQNSPVV